MEILIIEAIKTSEIEGEYLSREDVMSSIKNNVRIGRVLAEFTLSQGLKRPVILSLSKTIEKRKKQYYEQLKQAQCSLDITAWVNYLAQVIIEAQIDAKELIYFTLQKAKFFDRYQAQLNERALKVINRMFENGPAGFEGAMTAKKYIAIAKTSKATATRDYNSCRKLAHLNKRAQDVQ